MLGRRRWDGRLVAMLRRILDWNRRRKEWNSQHVAAWEGRESPGPSGLSPFQELFEARLNEELSSRGLKLEDRTIEKSDAESWIHGHLFEKRWEMWIYPNQVEAMGPAKKRIGMEAWDALTPEEFVKKYLGVLMHEWDSGRL